MSEAEASHRESWRRRFGRNQFMRPWLLYFIGSLYAAIYLIVATLMYVLNWIVPHLPWIPKPYVSPDPPPLVTAFYCANFTGAFTIILALLVFIGGPRRQIRPLWPRNKRKD